MNPLYDQFPDSVNVCGIEYPIITDFREWIKFCDLIETDELTGREKTLLMLEWYEDSIPPDYEKAILALGHFLGAYELYQDKLDTNGGKSVKRAYSFSQDASDIYSAFYVYYGLDLSKIGYMHWWKFRMLFDTLPMESEIKQKMYYRTMDPNTIKNLEERKRVVELQRKIKLKEKNKGYVDDYEIGEAFT